MAGLGGRDGPGGVDPADFFAQFFTGSGGFSFEFESGGPSRRRGKGQDSVIPYDVTLDDLYNGKAVKMNMEKEVVCSVCKGSVIATFWSSILTHGIAGRGHGGTQSQKPV